MQKPTIIHQGPGEMYMAAGNEVTLIKLDSEIEFSNVQAKNDPNNFPWASWGTDNKLPITMAQKISKCGVLSAGIEAKARIAIGKGMRPVVITGVDDKGEDEYSFVTDADIDAWFEDNQVFKNSLSFIRNTIGYGWSHGRIILDNDGKKIARYRTDEVAKCRLKRKDDTGKITGTYYAADWAQILGSDNDKYLKEFTILEEGEEYHSLKEIIDSNAAVKEFAIISRGPLGINEYYPAPAWYSCIDWVDMAIKVPAMKVAMMNNQMSIKYIITISDRFFSKIHPDWGSYTAEQKAAAFQTKAMEINDHLSGNDKAYKSIVTGSYIDPVTLKETQDINIQVIDDKVKDGKLLPDSGAANKEVLFALMINPAIMGANTFGGDYSGGAGSGSDIREAYLVQIMLMENERQMNAGIFDVVKRINGWDKKTYTVKNKKGEEVKIPGTKLCFKYPNLILTTLDKGGSTAPAKM